MLTISHNYYTIRGVDMLNFGEAERRILSYFVIGTNILYKGKEYTIVEADKPRCSNGEPKTDIFVRLHHGDIYEDIKISYKKENADFLENKTNAERAENLLGSNWRKIIQNSTATIQDQFRSRALIYKEKFRKTEKGSMTLGWKFELLNKSSGDLSGRLELSEEQVYDVYAGTNLTDDKKNAIVHGKKIQNSGIANYILNVDHISSAQEAIDKMIPISEYIHTNPHIYFACKALNYRTFKSKYDGNRPLAVQVNWVVNDGKLDGNLVFDSPLEMNGTEMATRLIHCLNLLGIHNTDDIDENNADMNNVYRGEEK
jgi:hypothetical protein